MPSHCWTAIGADGWKLAGGNDSLSWFKERAKRPKAVIDITGIAELKGIRETPDGIEIGALTTLTEVERNPVIRANYRVLADAARRVASPQIRNTGTMGGNVSQDARCLVLPLRPALLSRRRQHLLRRHAGRREPRACAVRYRPLHRGQPVGHRARAGGAGCEVRHPQHEGRAGHRRRGVLHRTEDRHHASDLGAAARNC